MSGHEAVDNVFMADLRSICGIRPDWGNTHCKRCQQTEESATVKHARLIRILTTLVAAVISYWPGVFCFAQSSRQAVPPIAARSLSAPAIYRTDHFFLVSEKESATSPALGSSLEGIRAKIREAMAARGLMLEDADDPLLWVCFDDREQYRQYALDVEHASPVFRDAFYSTRTNRVVLFNGQLPVRVGTPVHLTGYNEEAAPEHRPASNERIVVLTHEMTHQLAYNSGLQKRGVMYPLWVSEGLATYFESCSLAKTGRVASQGRKARLVEMTREGRLLPLYELAVLAGPGALGRSPADVYAQCWGFMGFLLEHHDDELSAYLGDLRDTPQGRRSSTALRRQFVTHFGSIDTLEQSWHDFVVSLSEPTTDEDDSLTAGF